MKTYTVHIPPQADSPLEKAILLREGGFSFLAGIFGFLWALYYRMWLCASVLFCVQAFLGFLEFNNILPLEYVILLRSAYFVIVGLWANDWRREDLEAKGSPAVEIIVADNDREARHKLFHQHQPLETF